MTRSELESIYGIAPDHPAYHMNRRHRLTVSLDGFKNNHVKIHIRNLAAVKVSRFTEKSADEA